MKIEILQAIFSGITTLAALTGAVVAILGLNAWRKQLRGKNDYELAKRYLRAVYKTRDAVKYVRNPFIPVGEMVSALEEEGKDESLSSNHTESNRAVYVVRWKKVTEANSDLEVELREAEVSWGKEAVEMQKDFQECVKKLFVSLKMFLDVKELKPERDIIYDMGEKDEYNKRMEKSIEKIEKYLQPHLK